jgi:hypothetical protein
MVLDRYHEFFIGAVTVAAALVGLLFVATVHELRHRPDAGATPAEATSPPSVPSPPSATGPPSVPDARSQPGPPPSAPGQ